jgi:hypothetical protein
LYERSFEEVGAPADGDSGSLAKEDQLNLKMIAAIGVEYGIEILRPSHSTVERGLDRLRVGPLLPYTPDERKGTGDA